MAYLCPHSRPAVFRMFKGRGIFKQYIEVKWEQQVRCDKQVDSVLYSAKASTLLCLLC